MDDMNFRIHRIDYVKVDDIDQKVSETNAIVRKVSDITFEELCESYHMSRRDRYIIDKNIDLNVCTIVLKKNCMIVQIDFIRSIITTDHALIFLDRSKTDVHRVIDSMRKTLYEKRNRATDEDDASSVDSDCDEDHINDEFNILEEIFIFISRMYEEMTDSLMTRVSEINRRFNGGSMDGDLRDVVYHTNSKVIDLRTKVNDIKDKLEEILAWDDDDKEEFLLDRVYNDEEDKKSVVDSVESLLENYKSHFEDYGDKLKKMDQQLDLFVEKLNLFYADKRNQIAMFNTRLAITSIAISIAEVISSALGMNLKNHIEDSSFAFFIVVAIILVIIGIVCGVAIAVFKRIEH